jgi:iron complex transport system ATP-binding protein
VKYASIFAPKRPSRFTEAAKAKTNFGEPMNQYKLVGEGIRLIYKDNILAVISDSPLNTVSSAFHNGGVKKTHLIINAQVLPEYNDDRLHQDPEKFIQLCFNKLGLDIPADGFVGMVTFAVVEMFSIASMYDGDLGVSAVTTGGCTHAESAGENTDPHTPHPPIGTINVIVIIDGNPTESCMVGSIITATEAKTAALKQLDVRSLYSGDEATGTPSDAIVIAKTGRGPEITYSGPASPLGRLIGACTKRAVKEAVGKAPIGGYPLGRPLKQRLKERHLSVDKLACELAKAKCLNADEKTIKAALSRLLESDPVFASMLFAATELSDDFSQCPLPELGDLKVLGNQLGGLLPKASSVPPDPPDCRDVDLHPFLRHVLVAMLKDRLPLT